MMGMMMITMVKVIKPILSRNRTPHLTRLPARLPLPLLRPLELPWRLVRPQGLQTAPSPTRTSMLVWVLCIWRPMSLPEAPPCILCRLALRRMRMIKITTTKRKSKILSPSCQVRVAVIVVEVAGTKRRLAALPWLAWSPCRVPAPPVAVPPLGTSRSAKVCACRLRRRVASWTPRPFSRSRSNSVTCRRARLR